MSNQQCFNIRDKGACEFGSDCRFLHPGSETRASRQKASQVCYSLRDEGACKYGADCRFSHDLKLAAEAKPKVATAKPAAAAAAGGEQKAGGAGEKRERAPRRRRRGGAAGAGGEKPKAVSGAKPAAKVEGKTEVKAASNGTTAAATEKKTFTAPAGAGRLSCYQFKQNGSCEFGERCRFVHEGSSAQTRGSKLKNTEVCYALRDEGACKFGSDCRYSHDLKSAGDSVGAKRERAPRPARTARPAPTERSDKVCYRWEKDGSCKFGDDCRFVHPAE
jgi:hypothetical protein